MTDLPPDWLTQDPLWPILATLPLSVDQCADIVFEAAKWEANGCTREEAERYAMGA